MDKINYVVACYLGERRVKTVKNPVVFIKKHLEYLRDNSIKVDRVSVVLNARDKNDIIIMQRVLKEFTPYYTELKLFNRSNDGYSYGAWNDAVTESLSNNEGFTHFFLVEDDYVPARIDFLDVFLSKCNAKNAFVCQKVYEAVEGGFPRHPAVSNGMLLGEAAVKACENSGSALTTMMSMTYPQAEHDQLHFLDGIEECGYTYTDTADVAGLVFLAKSRDPLGYTFIELNLESGKPLLMPITE